MFYKKLKNTMDSLAKIVVENQNFESAFLGALGNMEEIAAREIIKTLNSETPKEALLEVVQHAQDEHRHAFQLRHLKPVKHYNDLKYYALESELTELGVNFVLGFFGQQQLLKARSASRFAGYVHGALTIEQVPIQMYTAYYKLTQIEAVKSGMTVVLKDEADHLALGRKFYETLSTEERLDIDEINQIEMEMCELLGRKMIESINKVKNNQDINRNALEKSICENRKTLSSWILALAENEKQQLRQSHCNILKDSILFILGETKKELNLNLEEHLQVVQKMSLEQLRQHYLKLASETKLVGVCYALERVSSQFVTPESSIQIDVLT